MKSLILRKKLYFFVCILFFYSCTKNDLIREPAPLIQQNLIANGNFEHWNPYALVPEDWTLEFPYNYFQDVIYNENSISWSRNSEGRFLVYQTIKVEKDKYYKVKAFSDFDIKDHSIGGVYVYDEGEGAILGMADFHFKKGIEEIEFVFNSYNNEYVTVYLGFFNGMNGSIKFSNIEVIEYKFTPSFSNSPFSAYLNVRLNLSFDEARFDRSVALIADFLNKNLQCEFIGNNCEKNTNWLLRLTSKDNYQYFNTFLNERNTNNIAFCQKSSWSLHEVLKNEFNVAVRQVHMNFNGVGMHQFTEYWNPFLKKWVAFDTYFGCHFIREGVLLNATELESSDILETMKKVATSFVRAKTEEMLWFWSNVDELTIGLDNLISYPYKKF